MKQIITIVPILIFTTLSWPQEALNQLSPVSDHSLILFVRNRKTGEVDPNIALNATYAGFLTSTNDRGQILLPRKTESKHFKIIITPQILPVFSVLNNVLHWVVAEQSSAKAYLIKMIKDEQTEINIWHVEQTALPADQHIPLHAIVIFADPEKVDIQTGFFPTKSTEQLVLPSLLAEAGSNSPLKAVQLPNQKPFFKQLKTAYALTPYGYATLQAR